MTYLGQFALWAAFLVGAWGAALAFFGRWSERPALATAIGRSSYALCAALLVAAAALWKGIFTHDFNIEYVAAYTSRNLPDYYLISAFWAGQKGSLLFWAVVLSIFGALAQALTSQRFRAMLPYVAGIANVVTIFFVAVMLFADTANPFERLPFTPDDGRGLNPQLQNPGMIIHPPMLYLGYISLTIPFAFAMAALLAKQLDAGWIVAMRKWALTSWLFLSIGITIGMWWAYVELGWGGVWAWDPVENASLLPWLTLTAFLHSVMIQEKRGMLKRWNMGLIVGTFLLTIFGTFITRSGVIASVHSFTQSAVGYFFLAFLLVAGILSFTLLYTRWPLLEPEAQLESMVSREGAFLYNNLALLGIAFSVLWGTLFPILSEAVRGTKITVGPPFFNRVNIPLGLFLLFLTGVGPLIAWRKASIANLQRQFIAPLLGGVTALTALLVGGLRNPWALVSLSLAGFVLVTVIQEFGRGVRARMTMHNEGVPIALARLVARNRRRYGGYIVHVAMLIYFVAFTGLAFPAKTTVDLQPGQQTTLKSPFGHTWTFTHLGVSQYSALNRRVSAATVELLRDGKRMGTIKSEKRQHVDSFGRKTFEASTEVGIRSDLLEDVYVVYAGSPDGTERASYSLLINPLVGWFWIGGAILTLGGLLTMWPGGPQVKVARRRASIQAGYTVPLAGVAE
ncbi:MAG TPA: cytochrome c-type biogenesis CcmF C-terminal domain-containing protein [Gemmatimonadales bacterium]|jgi:cytochrome c-type biogenesis protein CcmF|nr:cytochrome c-type biogenesis CcmF C-terminal domain-containing protein [Gemmatimonadales bacterium]